MQLRQAYRSADSFRSFVPRFLPLHRPSAAGLGPIILCPSCPKTVHPTADVACFASTAKARHNFTNPTPSCRSCRTERLVLPRFSVEQWLCPIEMSLSCRASTLPSRTVVSYRLRPFTSLLEASELV